MHRADREAAWRGLDLVAELDRWRTTLFRSCPRAAELRRGANKDADLMRCHTLGDTIGDPPADRLGLFVRIGEDLDRGRGAVEHGHRPATILGIAVDIGDR